MNKEELIKSSLPLFSKVEIDINLKCTETGITHVKKEICTVVGSYITDSTDGETLVVLLDIDSIKNRGYTGYSTSKFIKRNVVNVRLINKPKN